MADSSLRLLLLLQQIPREPRSVSSQELHERLEDAGYPVLMTRITLPGFVDKDGVDYMRFPRIAMDGGTRELREMQGAKRPDVQGNNQPVRNRGGCRNASRIKSGDSGKSAHQSRVMCS